MTPVDITISQTELNLFFSSVFCQRLSLNKEKYHFVSYTYSHKLVPYFLHCNLRPQKTFPLPNTIKLQILEFCSLLLRQHIDLIVTKVLKTSWGFVKPIS